ncbi:hypothetical protein LJR066_006706 [Acidovorax sp. LjRoot66]|uniref:hypothetical protein n=1 Tax=Acidovorax sp. LjRoot66 TaxID=3342334 RepID=UPI003ED11CDA
MTTGPLPKTVSFETTNGTVTLPFAGAQYLAALGEGIRLQVLGALGTIGHEEIARSWLWASDDFATKTLMLEQRTGELNQTAGISENPADFTEMLALASAEYPQDAIWQERRSAQDRARAHMERTWSKVHAILLAARNAIDETGYDGSPS